MWGHKRWRDIVCEDTNDGGKGKQNEEFKVTKKREKIGKREKLDRTGCAESSNQAFG